MKRTLDRAFAALVKLEQLHGTTTPITALRDALEALLEAAEASPNGPEPSAAADLWERQALQPVPVSERLPRAEDCAPWPGKPNAVPWCWFGSDVCGAWSWEQRSASEHTYIHRLYSHWLPASALPLPTTTTTEATDD